jgi:hypothetical protein
LLQRRQFDKYDPIFNFFFAKPISDISEGADTPEYRLLRELNYLDSDTEFLKRFYRSEEVPERIELLYCKLPIDSEIHHPEQPWAVELPTLVSNVGRKYVLKYAKRQKKMYKKLVEIQ